MNNHAGIGWMAKGPGSTHHLNVVRGQSAGTGMPVYHNPNIEAFCEGCQTHQPRPKFMKKGWRCATCKEK